MDKRIILPAFFGLLTVILIGAYASQFLFFPIPAVIIKLLIGGIVAALAAAMFYVIIQRNREIKEEDKDDLGKY
jgi:uncharacterized membrane protein YfcA